MKTWGLMSDDERSAITRVTALLDMHFPQVHVGGAVKIARLSPDATRVIVTADESQIRPGGTVSGPTMFKLADLAIYVILLGRLGEDALQAVTTNMTMNFMRRPPPTDIIGEGRLLKFGKRLAVAEVGILAADGEGFAAHATGTYIMPN